MRQPPSKKAASWATHLFRCRVHREEAAALFDTLAKLSPKHVENLDPDTTLADWLAEGGLPRVPRS